MPRLIPSLIRASLGSSRVALSAVLLARSSLRGAASIAHAKCTARCSRLLKIDDTVFHPTILH